jgi:MATE family multidrug resistance protein
MVPLGVATAAAVLVGQAVGAGDVSAARWHAASALVCGVLFMLTSASLFLLAPGFLARLYTADAAVVAVTSVLLPLAGVFQVFDGVQAVSGGVLRGAGDVRAPMLSNLLGFWAVGLPTGVLLAFGVGLGPAGLWWGLVAGLCAVALLLLRRVRVKLSRHVARVDVERGAMADA